MASHDNTRFKVDQEKVRQTGSDLNLLFVDYCTDELKMYENIY